MNKSALNFASSIGYLAKHADELSSDKPYRSSSIDQSKPPGSAKVTPQPPISIGKSTHNAVQWPDYMQMLGLPPRATRSQADEIIGMYPGLDEHMDMISNQNQLAGAHPSAYKPTQQLKLMNAGGAIKKPYYKLQTELGQDKGR